MNCEEFAMAGLDLGSASEDSPRQQAAREHLLTCSHCASLHENWQALRGELRDLAVETRDAKTPARVQMRLRQEFRATRNSLQRRWVANFATWGLAAAALLLGTFSWVQWKNGKTNQGGPGKTPAVAVNEKGSSAGAGANHIPAAGPELGETLVASNDSDEFTLLPGTMPGSLDDAMVVRVQMQRGVLGSLGLTVSEDRAADWIQVDLLLGDDGQPRAVRLPSSSN